jgi:hypothetical protein
MNLDSITKLFTDMAKDIEKEMTMADAIRQPETEAMIERRNRKNIKEPEKVNHPSHYGGDTTYEVIKVLEHWLSKEEFIGWLKGTILKYLPRAGKKEGESSLVDLKKGLWYLNRLVKFLEEKGE